MFMCLLLGLNLFLNFLVAFDGKYGHWRSSVGTPKKFFSTTIWHQLYHVYLDNYKSQYRKRFLF